MKKLFPLIFLCISALALIYSCDVQNDLSSGLLRMHIIANSNSEHDQQTKLTVRNEILNTVNKNSTLNSIEETACRTLADLNEKYGARVYLENCFVPMKTYKNISLPEGNYNCLKIVLGSGNGENWWCVAYPPLCYTEDMFGEISESGKKQLETALSSESLKTIVYNGDINIRFKIVEEMQKLRRNLLR